MLCLCVEEEEQGGREGKEEGRKEECLTGGDGGRQKAGRRQGRRCDSVRGMVRGEEAKHEHGIKQKLWRGIAWRHGRQNTSPHLSPALSVQPKLICVPSSSLICLQPLCPVSLSPSPPAHPNIATLTLLPRWCASSTHCLRVGDGGGGGDVVTGIRPRRRKKARRRRKAAAFHSAV